MRILYLDIDCLRPDHLGCYGYHRDTSPTIDHIASKGIRFTNMYCSDAPCLPSRMALMTGMFGIHSGVVGHGGTAAELRVQGASRGFKSRLEVENLPGVLSSNGYKTVSISPFATRHGAWSFYAGFDEIYNTGRSGMESADEVTPIAVKWLNENGLHENWFLHVNFWDPHTPYRVPQDFGNPFQDDPIPSWLTQEVLSQHLARVGPHKPKNLNGFSNQPSSLEKVLPKGSLKTPTEIRNFSDLKQLFDGYDIAIRYIDNHIKQILVALEQKGILDDIAVIISSDHGENLGELGIYAEHGTADNATCRIPMVIKWPGRIQGISDSRLHYHLDLAPTITELLGLRAPPIWDGQSFDCTIKNSSKKNGRDFLILSQCAHVCQRSVRFEDWLYIRSYHDGFHLFPQEQLYDLAIDPHEQRDLTNEMSHVCKEAVYLLCQWHDQMMSSMHSDVDPLWTVIKEGGPYHARGSLESYFEFLEKSGQIDAAHALRDKHPREFGKETNPIDYAREAFIKNLFNGFQKRNK